MSSVFVAIADTPAPLLSHTTLLCGAVHIYYENTPHLPRAENTPLQRSLIRGERTGGDAIGLYIFSYAACKDNH